MIQPRNDAIPKPNYLAVLSLVAGVFAVVGVGAQDAVAALACGVVAVGVAPYALARKFQKRGRLQAISGIILGSLPLLLFLYATIR